ncbi:PLP-dependent aminotransferase family protein [Brevibacillus parabrevis]|uniref:aminotransferase-like domain-containing protein n=1 Tax=Brevibacillus parabrevis TaxID=54914 RepID=UPI001F60036C|nr:PLP-dependent aminotransferase family protein [Brevibacillus parabrevis]
MHISLDKTGKESLTVQIAQAVIERISSVIYEAGELLPSVRKLAKEIGVSVLTVIRAYKIVEEKGYAVTLHGKGTYVRRLEKAAPPAASHDYEWQESYYDYVGRSIFGQQTPRGSRLLFPFHSATLSKEEHLPFEALQKATALAARDPHTFAEYSSPLGDLPLREHLAHAFQQRGIRVTESELMVTTGCQQGIDLVARTFAGPGDIVMVESPTYPAALDAFRSRGATILPIPCDSSGIRIDLLTRMFDQRPPKLIYVIPTGQNPTGKIMSEQTRRSLLALAESFHCLIVEDDPWSELHYTANIPPSICSMDQNGHVIYLKGYSKVIAPGLRIGCLVARGSVFLRLANVKAIADLATPLFNQRSFYHLLQTVSDERYFESVRAKMKRKKERVDKLLRQHGGASLTWEAPQAGPNFWLQTSANTEALSLLAKPHGLSFLPGAACFTDLSGGGHIRIGFGSVPDDKLEEGIALLCRLIEKQRKELYEPDVLS